MLSWLGQAIRDFYTGYGWVAALITFVVLVGVIAGILWLFGVPLGAIIERRLTGGA